MPKIGLVVLYDLVYKLFSMNVPFTRIVYKKKHKNTVFRKFCLQRLSNITYFEQIFTEHVQGRALYFESKFMYEKLF